MFHLGVLHNAAEIKPIQLDAGNTDARKEDETA